jgi:Fe2+ transport system protein FeoA
MVRKVESQSREVEDTLRALRRAAKRALELGLKTGTPVYVMENGKIVDLTKRKRSATKVVTRKAKTTRAKTSR